MYLTENSSPSTLVYLDAIWLEVNYEELTEKTLTTGVKHDWKFSEEPAFDISEQNTGFWKRFKNIFNKNKLEISLVMPDGQETKNGLIIQESKIKINKKATNFRPGLYKLKIKQDNEIIIQEFSWGVLAINTNKSIYLPNETAYLQMAALKDDGHTICDANLKLEITSPNGELFSVTVQKSGECGPNNITDKPDYFAYYQVEEQGVYQMTLTNLDKGYTINDSFEVRD